MVNVMHGLGTVSNYGSGYQPVCNRLISELQSGNCSYFSFLKSLLGVLDHAVESIEMAESIVGQSGTEGCRIDARCLAISQVRLRRVSEAVSAVIQTATASEDKEEISLNFLKQTCNALIRQCFDALYHLSNSRHRLDILAEHYTDAFSSVSSAVPVLVDAIALMRQAHTYVTTGNTAESSAIIGTRRRIERCMNAVCYAIHAVPGSTIRSSVDASGGGCSAPEIREMTCYLLKEAALLSSLIHNREETANRDSASYAHSALEAVLLRLLHGLAPSCPDTRFFAAVLRAAMTRTSEEYKDWRDQTEGMPTSDCSVIHQRNLSLMLLESSAMVYLVNASCAKRVQEEGKPDHCARSVLKTLEKVQQALSTLKGRKKLCVAQSLRDANVCSFIIGSVADAQQLIDNIDMNALPNPALQSVLLNRTREILSEAGALCIRLQCAGDPEYRIPEEAVFDLNTWNIPSTHLAAISTVISFIFRNISLRRS